MTSSYELSARQLLVLTLACCAISCVSLYFAALIYPEFHIAYHSRALLGAVLAVCAFAGISPLFAIARFNFGYLVGFFFYIMILGYTWLNFFSDLDYNHALAGISAPTSALSFLLPALLINHPFRQVHVLSTSAVDRLLTLILLIAIATISASAQYSFKLVSIERIYEYREELAIPTALNYLNGITSSALLPFAFACFAVRRHFWRAGLVVILMLLFYPITLSKMALLAPVWLVGLSILSRIIDCRTTVVLSVLAPLSIGVMIFVLFRSGVLPDRLSLSYFGLVNFRMIAVPSLAMEYYNFFFAQHDLTYFCQIQLLKPFLSCPYAEPLGVVIFRYFGIGGYFNASLFATEGIASVGLVFAPITAFACGLIIAVGNRLSAGLPARFILMSGAVLSQAFLNVPLTTVMLSHGAGLVFLLWYLMPRELFETGQIDPKPG